MIVVADSSPLIVLVNIGHIEILPALFGEVFIPPQIAAELSEAKRPHPVRNFIAGKPAWLRIQAPANVELIPEIHECESAAISLASELKADLLLIDERDGRSAARPLSRAVSRSPAPSGSWSAENHCRHSPALDVEEPNRPDKRQQRRHRDKQAQVKEEGIQHVPRGELDEHSHHDSYCSVLARAKAQPSHRLDHRHQPAAMSTNPKTTSSESSISSYCSNGPVGRSTARPTGAWLQRASTPIADCRFPPNLDRCRRSCRPRSR
jgi:predicted nucleic acid-binding protein